MELNIKFEMAVDRAGDMILSVDGTGTMTVVQAMQALAATQNVLEGAIIKKMASTPGVSNMGKKQKANMINTLMLRDMIDLDKKSSDVG